MKRILTTNEEQAIRLVHHDHGGESIENAATHMGRSVRAVKRLLVNAKKKAPQIFPILTPRHRAILTMYDQHISQEAMACGLDISIVTLQAEITFLRKHKFLWDRKPDQYRSWMDHQVKEKF